MRRLTPRIAAAVLLLVVGLAAWIQSFDALVAFARAANIREQLAWAYPVVVDGQLTAGLVAAYALRRASLPRRAYVWALIAGSSAVSIVANYTHSSAHDGAVSLPLAVAGAASAVPALSLFSTLHLAVLIARAGDGPARTKTRTGTRTKARTSTRIKARAQELAAEGLPPAAIAQKIKRSASQARRLVAPPKAAN